MYFYDQIYNIGLDRQLLNCIWNKKALLTSWPNASTDLAYSAFVTNYWIVESVTDELTQKAHT